MRWIAFTLAPAATANEAAVCPYVVGCDVGQACGCAGGVEDSGPPVVDPQDAALGSREDEVIGLLALAHHPERLRQAGQERDGPRLVVLRSGPYEAAADLGDALGHDEAGDGRSRRGQLSMRRVRRIGVRSRRVPAASGRRALQP